jgi:ribonuclease J
LTENFIQAAKEAEPAALICEGTRMAEHETRQNYSEPQVKEISDKIVKATDKAVFTMHASRDIDRFKSFYEVAKKNNRKMVITPKTAYLLTKLLGDEHLPVPDPLKDDGLKVYYKRKKSGKYDERDYFLWERKFMDKMVDCEYVRKNQRKLIMDLDFFQFGELIDIKPESGSHFIHSMSEPFSEEDIEDQVMHNWLDHFKLQFHQVHASGHMSKEQLVEMVNEVSPKKTFAVHTENQKLFKAYCSNIHLIEKEKEYCL